MKRSNTKIELLKAGITQQEIAKECGVTRGAVSHVVNNRSKSKRIEACIQNRLARKRHTGRALR